LISNTENDKNFYKTYINCLLNNTFHLYFQGRKWYINHFDSTIKEYNDSNEVFVEMKIEKKEKNNCFIVPFFKLNSQTKWNANFKSVARDFFSLILQTTSEIEDLKKKIPAKSFMQPFSMFHVYIKNFGKLVNVIRPIDKLIPWPLRQKEKRVLDNASQLLVSNWQVEVQKNEKEALDSLFDIYKYDRNYSEIEMNSRRKKMSLESFRMSSSESSTKKSKNKSITNNKLNDHESALNEIFFLSKSTTPTQIMNDNKDTISSSDGNTYNLGSILEDYSSDLSYSE
jgi:hypothetical protein